MRKRLKPEDVKFLGFNIKPKEACPDILPRLKSVGF